MSKELITAKVFQSKVLDKFRELFLHSHLNYSGTKKERKELVSLLIERYFIEHEDFNAAFVTEYLSNLKCTGGEHFYKYLCLGTALATNGVSFSEQALAETVFKNIDKDEIKKIHSRFTNMKVNSELYKIALIATREVMESFRYNNSITFDPNFSMNDALYSLMEYATHNLGVVNDKTMEQAGYFQKNFIQDCKFKINRNTLDEEDITNICKSMSGFWYHNHKDGYTLTPLYFEFFKMLDNINMPSLNQFLLELKREAFNSHIISLEDLTNKEEAKRYFSIDFNDNMFSMKENLIRIKEEQLKVFDLNNLFITSEQKKEKSLSIEDLFKKSKNISGFLIKRDDDGMISIQWKLSNVESKEMENKLNESIQVFIKDKLENIENYVGDVSLFAPRLRNECRELDLLLTLTKMDKKQDNKKKKVKI